MTAGDARARFRADDDAQSDARDSPMLIAHLSDPHLRPGGVLYQGLVDSNAMFEAAPERMAATGYASGPAVR